MAAISGQKTVTVAGTAESLGNQVVNGPLLVKALDSNTGTVAVGNDGAGDVSLANGMRLAPGETLRFAWVGNLNQLWVDVDNLHDGEGVSWILLRL